ncbi:MAG: metallophosphoesterase [Clostridia bacterium]|nr:metallophosphoesterase [Clostridia bacterium]
MNILKTELNLGLQEPLRILQVSDCHLSGCCEADSERAREKSKKKTADFRREAGGIAQEDRFAEALKLAEDCDALVLTGDIADSPSPANLQTLESMLEGHHYLYTFGNHDYYTYDSDSGKAEDRERFLDEFLRFLPCDPTMDAMEVGGVNLVTLDDSLAQFSGLQLEFLKSQIAKGLPILLFLHLPIYSPSFAPQAYDWWDSSMSVGTPAEVLEAHNETDPKMPAQPATLAVLELIREEPLIRAVFASHLHFADEAEVLGKPQFVSEPCYLGSVREIVIK